MKKLFTLILSLAVFTVDFAVAEAVETTVYYAVPDGPITVDNSAKSFNKVYVNVNHNGDSGYPDDWEQKEMTITDKTYFGKTVYVCTFNSKNGGLGCLEFQLYNDNQQIWNHQIFGTHDWKSSDFYKGKMGEFGQSDLRTFNYDKTVTIHFKNTGEWSSVDCYNFFDDGVTNGGVYESAWPGNSANANSMFSGWYEYKIKGRPCSSVIFNNGKNSNESGAAETQSIAIGDESDYWIESHEANTATSTTPNDCKYTRPVTSGNFGTICLAYASTVTGATVFRITKKIMDGVTLKGINLESVESLEAGKAYIFKATSSTLTASCYGTSEDASDSGGILGNLSNNDIEVPENNYIIFGNKLCKVVNAENLNESYVYVGQYKAYITLTGIEAASARGTDFISSDSENTGIEVIENDALERQISQVYNLAGQRIAKPAKGLFIVNGKKMLNN